ncbi:hypothetical protein J8I87_41025 [Paraburkholderia sp. LEh10]|jgi:hypothetical protein|uniref:hypothetical protein n=1 Tax=Paraburkholderia sp. LEh10 TaxID=2821353 RepID=UPI001AE1C4BB|nr:hypothetical protein [Paraburkholderia sp. LEh10]MBP0595894.1 hypothetical protein [Paraburkholderia sp. LEh10]
MTDYRSQRAAKHTNPALDLPANTRTVFANPISFFSTTTGPLAANIRPANALFQQNRNQGEL